MTVPYRLIKSRPETGTVDNNGKEGNISNNHCVHDRKTEPADPNRQEDAKGSTVPSTDTHPSQHHDSEA